MEDLVVFDTTFAITVLALIAIAVPLILLFVNWLLHPGRIQRTLIKGSAYECGLAHVSGTANERYPVKYYLVAMLFLVFDLEIVFLYPWAVQYSKGGWELFYILIAFLFILEGAYFYLYKKGVLSWATLKD